MFRVAWLVLKKDLTIERRSREVLFTVLTFSLLATVVFGLSFYIEGDRSKAYAPGVLWVIVLFSGTLSLQRLFEPERDNDCLGGLLLAPVDPRGVYVGKVLLQIAFSGLMEVVTVPMIFLFFGLFEGLDAVSAGIIASALILGTIGFALVGTLFAALLLRTKMREVLLPVVIYPLVSPVLIGGVQLTRELLTGESPDAVMDWIGILAAFDLIYLGLCLWVFPYLIRD